MSTRGCGGGSAWYRFGVRAVAGRIAGFGLSTALLAVASLAATPAMVAASGPAAWGAIALGQSVGAVACVVVGFGWPLSGPAIVARGDPSVQRREYVDSVRVKLVLLIPGATTAALVAVVLAPHQPSFAAAGAISGTAVGLTSSWYFAGLARPYVWLLFEILPRVGGTAVGIAVMKSGYSAILGIACTTSGMMLAFLLATAWVYRSTARAGADRLPGGKLIEVLNSHRHGVASMVGTFVFLSTPMAIVSVVAPTAQPVFALVDKVRQLVGAGLNPLVLVLQGWVPRGGDSNLGKRGRVALGATSLVAVAFSAVFLPAAPYLMRWLSAGQIAVPEPLLVLAAVVIAIGLHYGVLENAVLAAFDRLDIVTRATAASIIAMLPAVMIGTIHFGAIGAIVGTIFGQIVRIIVDLAGARRINTSRSYITTFK
jgi:O-antigen/teichoic acid export membrane protein